MLKEPNRLLCLLNNICILLICFSCTKAYHGEIFVIESYKKSNNFIKLYSPDCYVHSEKNVFQIENILHYTDGKLIEVINPSAESLIYYKRDNGGEIPEIYKQYNSLSVKKKGNNILYLNNSYPIVKKRNDSIFVKTKEAEKYLIFVGNIPQ